MFSALVDPATIPSGVMPKSSILLHLQDDNIMRKPPNQLEIEMALAETIFPITSTRAVKNVGQQYPTASPC
jgi:hypothetical protein